MTEKSSDRGSTFFGDGESAAAEETPYRAISAGSIFALFLGLASAAAFFAPLLWAIPAFGVVFALIMLRKLRSESDRYTGERLVWAGLSLCLLFLGWAPARYVQRLTIIEARGRVVAQEWVKMVCDGRLQAAHQWHLPAAERAAPGNAAAFYKERPEMAKLQQEFFARDLLAQWLQLGAEQKSRFVRFVGRDASSSGSENYIYEFVVSGPTGLREMPIFVVISRRTQPGQTAGELVVANVLGLDPYVKE